MSPHELRKLAEDTVALPVNESQAERLARIQLARSVLQLLDDTERDIAQLKLRPPMGCYTCEVHNDQLVERIERMCEAVCESCARSAAFVDAQKWPLPPRQSPEQTDEEFEALVAEIKASSLAAIDKEEAARREAFIQGFVHSKDPKTAHATLLVLPEAEAAYAQWRESRS